MQRKGYRRKKLIISGFQYRLIVFHIAQFVAVVLFVMGSIYGPLMLKLDRGSLSELQKLEVANQLMGLNQVMLPTLWMVFGLIIVHSVIVSNRIAGPVYRIRRVLRAVRDGDLTQRLKLRRHDYLLGDASLLNDMVESLETRVRDLSASCRRIEDELNGVISAGNLPESAGARVHTLRRESEELKRLLGQFELEAGDAADLPTRDEAPVGA